MIDPADAESVIESVAAILAHRFRWLETDEIANDARLLCHDRGFFAKATTTGALQHFLSADLVRRYATEEERAPIGLADLDDEGTVYGYGEDSELVACGNVAGQVHGRHTRQGISRPSGSTAWRGTEDHESAEGRDWTPSNKKAEDNLPRHVAGGRSRLLDRFTTSSRGDFLSWARGALTDDSRWSAKAKAGHLEVYVNGSSREKDELWKRYVNAKKIGGTTTPEDREARLEDWQARYRWSPDAEAFFKHAPEFDDWPSGTRAPTASELDPGDRWARIQPEAGPPLVMSTDGSTVVVATLLREPIR